MTRIRVALCDDHPMVRRGLRLVLESAPDVEVVGEVGTAAEAVEMAGTEQPDVFLLDLTLPDSSGFDPTKRILAVASRTRVLILTMHDDAKSLRGAFEAGASGYLVKDDANVELLLAIREVAAGHGYIHPRLAAALLADRPEGPGPAGTGRG